MKNNASRATKLLFRWVGKGIEGNGLRRRAIVTPKQREDYLKHLDDALDSQKGLLAKKPGGEYLGRAVPTTERSGKSIWQFESRLPCLCFTELDLGESSDHWQRFGRLAFGFTKQFVLKCGGGPVQYCLGSKDCDTVRDLARVSNYLEQATEGGQESYKDVLAAFRRLSHYYKRVRPERVNRKSPENASRTNEKAKRRYRLELSGEVMRAREASYGYLNPMPHLEEHEWRLVYNDNHCRWHGIGGATQPESAWFRIDAGEELQVIILPDNRTLQKIQQCDFFCDRLFKWPKKPVQMLSLEAIVRIS